VGVGLRDTESKSTGDKKMNFRVTLNHSDSSGYKAAVRKFDRLEDACLWYGYCLAQEDGAIQIMMSNEQTGKIIVSTTLDWPTLGVRE
jgi:hypothetical protein